MNRKEERKPPNQTVATEPGAIQLGALLELGGVRVRVEDVVTIGKGELHLLLRQP
jgi:hypothetical protein